MISRDTKINIKLVYIKQPAYKYLFTLKFFPVTIYVPKIQQLNVTDRS